MALIHGHQKCVRNPTVWTTLTCQEPQCVDIVRQNIKIFGTQTNRKRKLQSRQHSKLTSTANAQSLPQRWYFQRHNTPNEMPLLTRWNSKLTRRRTHQRQICSIEQWNVDNSKVSVLQCVLMLYLHCNVHTVPHPFGVTSIYHLVITRFDMRRIFSQRTATSAPPPQHLAVGTNTVPHASKHWHGRSFDLWNFGIPNAPELQWSII